VRLVLSKLFVYDDYHLPEDDNHHSHRRGNLKSYKPICICFLRHLHIPYESPDDGLSGLKHVVCVCGTIEISLCVKVTPLFFIFKHHKQNETVEDSIKL
jgi:hypothetical protein